MTLTYRSCPECGVGVGARMDPCRHCHGAPLDEKETIGTTQNFETQEQVVFHVLRALAGGLCLTHGARSVQRAFELMGDEGVMGEYWKACEEMTAENRIRSPHRFPVASRLEVLDGGRKEPV